MNKLPRSIFFLFGAFLLCALPQAVFAKPGKNSENRIRLKTKLAAADGVDTEAKAMIRRKYRARKNGNRDRLKGKINVPIPSVVPSVADESAAAAADLRFRFSRSGTDYAECFVEFNEIDNDEPGEPEAVFKLDIRVRVKKDESRLREKKGSCDTDITTTEVESGVPDVQSGDTVTVVEVNGTDETTVLEGAL